MCRGVFLRELAVSEAIPGFSGVIVGDFRSSAYSDVLSNVNCLVLAEFLVAGT